MALNLVSDFHKRLKEALDTENLSVSDFAKKMGYSKQSISAYLNGTRSPKRPVIILIASTLDVNEAWLCGYDVPKERQIHIKNSNIFKIEKKKFPLLGNVACGKPLYANENRESYVEAGTNINADFCLRANGDSMINARICDGDIVFIRRQEMVENGEIAAVIIGDEATLKRVFYYPDKQKLILQAENPRYEPFVYIGEELSEVRILGKAIAFQSDVI